MHVSQNIVEMMENRLAKCLNVIESYNLNYEEIGIFGSYARGSYKATSDIDFCVIIKERPSLYVSGNLRDDLEELHADLIWVTPTSFENSDTLFMKNVRRDYKKLKEKVE
ncbi:nucleotidyltransferase family protein [Anaerobutyricum soehngenii]|uniref:nucleotidyltransferase family protein n=1 Tax=Anaerobutyricum soehngenii TaxID=105843 RepID=UPI0032C0E6BF